MCSGGAAWNHPLTRIPSVGIKSPPVATKVAFPPWAVHTGDALGHRRHSKPRLVHVASPVSRNHKTDTP